MVPNTHLFNITSSSYLGSLPFGRTGRQDHPVLKWNMSVLPNLELILAKVIMLWKDDQFRQPS